MIQKVAFTPQVNFKGIEVPHVDENLETKTQKDNSSLLYGTLAALGAFGVGLVAKKPKVVEKVIKEAVPEIEKTVKKLNPTEQEAIWKEAAKNHKNKYIVEQASQKTSLVSEKLRNISNPQMRPEINPELEKLKIDMIARSALNDAERINVSTPITEEIIQKSNPQMRPRMPKKGTHEYNVQHQEKLEELMEAFNSEAYKDMKIKQINGKNASERAKVNTVGNLVKQNEKRDLMKTRTKIQVEEKIANKLKNGYHTHSNGNVYEIKDGKVIRIIDKNTQKGKPVFITDEKKIAKLIQFCS